MWLFLRNQNFIPISSITGTKQFDLIPIFSLIPLHSSSYSLLDWKIILHCFHLQLKAKHKSCHIPPSDEYHARLMWYSFCKNSPSYPWKIISCSSKDLPVSYLLELQRKVTCCYQSYRARYHKPQSTPPRSLIWLSLPNPLTQSLTHLSYIVPTSTKAHKWCGTLPYHVSIQPISSILETCIRKTNSCSIPLVFAIKNNIQEHSNLTTF